MIKDLDWHDAEEIKTISDFLNIIDSVQTSTLSDIEDIINAEINKRYDYMEE